MFEAHRTTRRLVAALTAALAGTCIAFTGTSLAATPVAQFTTGSFASDVTTSVPATLSPASGATFAYPSSPIQLSWSPVAGASTYELQIAHANSAGDCSSSFTAQLAVYDDSSLTRTSWVPSFVDDDSGGASTASGPISAGTDTARSRPPPFWINTSANAERLSAPKYGSPVESAVTTASSAARQACTRLLVTSSQAM